MCKSKYFFWIIILFFFLASTAQAQVILKDGKTIDGVIVTKTDEFIQVDTGVGVIVTYYLDEISTIQGVSPQPVVDNKPVTQEESAQANLSPSALSQETVNAKVANLPGKKEITYPTDKEQVDERVDYQAQVIKASVDNLNKDFEKEIDAIKADLRKKIDSQTQKVNEQVDVILSVFQIFPKEVILPFLISWLICGIPMIFVAKNLNMPSPWLAGVPFLNFFVLLIMADKTIWWCLHFVYPIAIMVLPYYIPVDDPHLYFFTGYFILIVNIFLIPVFLWKYVFYLVRIPGWLSLLTTVPGLNVLLISLAGLPEDYQRTVKYAIFGKPKLGKKTLTTRTPKIQIVKNPIRRF